MFTQWFLMKLIFSKAMTITGLIASRFEIHVKAIMMHMTGVEQSSFFL